MLRPIAIAVFLFLSALALSACAQHDEVRQVAPAVAAANTAMTDSSSAPAPAYTLGSGDRLRITVFGEHDLSGEFEVNNVGKISMPLIGDIEVAKMTVAQAADSITQKLSGGYLRDPKVSIDVLNYRPFFILGEVIKPGSYPYVSGMTVVNAVAVAGGYTYRAGIEGVTVVRANDANKTEQKIEETGMVYPGDVVRVPERFF